MKNRNVFWGLILILGAVFLIFNNFGFFLGINVFTLFMTVVFAYWLAKGLRYMEFGSILFPIAFLCILYARPLHLTAITPWPVLGAALLGTIGLSMIFPKRRYYDSDHHYHGERYFSKTAEHINDDAIHFSNTFSECVKYVDTQNFKQADLSCSFGSMKVYFDKATITETSATIFTDTSFGDTQLYIPKEWNVINQMSCSFGDCKEFHKVTTDGYPMVTVTGNVSFGDCKIFYI